MVGLVPNNETRWNDKAFRVGSLYVGGTLVTATAAELNAVADGNNSYVKVTDAATYSVLAADSNKIHIMPDFTSSCTLSLPTAADGLRYEFWYGGVAADGQNAIISTGSDTNFFKGGVVHLDANSGTGADELVPVFPDGNSNSKLTITTPDAGSIVKMLCDGTNWFITGYVVSNTAPAFADQ